MELAVVSVSSELQGRTVHKQLAIFEALRRLGFASKEIYVSWSGRPNTVLMEGDRSFTMSYPETAHSSDEAEWLEEWLREANRWNNEMTAADRDRLYRQHVSTEVLGLLAIALKARGFRIRRSEN